MSFAKNSPLHPNPANPDIEDAVVRIAAALEKIADALTAILQEKKNG